jgi:hypothetical protein
MAGKIYESHTKVEGTSFWVEATIVLGVVIVLLLLLLLLLLLISLLQLLFCYYFNCCFCGFDCYCYVIIVVILALQQQLTDWQEGEISCYGHSCYRDSFLICSAVSAVALVTTAITPIQFTTHVADNNDNNNTTITTMRLMTNSHWGYCCGGGLVLTIVKL